MTRPKLVFVSQPMRGKDEEEIQSERDGILDLLPDILKEEVEEVPSYFKGPDVHKQNHPLYLLGMALQLMSSADYAVFAKGWEEARGCRIEHECALQYGIPIIDLSDGQYENVA